MDDRDQALVDAARDAIRARYRPGWHVVGAALRTRSGRVFTGVHLEAHVGRVAVCAEAIALGRAATESGDTEIDVIVAVQHGASREAEMRVVPPCGMCREMISDYARDASAIVPTQSGGVEKRPIADLLPCKYQGAR